MGSVRVTLPDLTSSNTVNFAAHICTSTESNGFQKYSIRGVSGFWNNLSNISNCVLIITLQNDGLVPAVPIAKTTVAAEFMSLTDNNDEIYGRDRSSNVSSNIATSCAADEFDDLSNEFGEDTEVYWKNS